MAPDAQLARCDGDPQYLSAYRNIAMAVSRADLHVAQQYSVPAWYAADTETATVCAS